MSTPENSMSCDHEIVPKLGDRVEARPEVMGGTPCIRGTRIPVAAIAAYRQAGKSVPEMLDAWPRLCQEDLAAAFQYIDAHPAQINAEVRDRDW